MPDPLRRRRRARRRSRHSGPAAAPAPAPAAAPAAPPGAPAAPPAATLDRWAVWPEGGEVAGALRVKELRSSPLMPGGRARITFFEAASAEERAHPRLRVELPPAADPTPPGPWGLAGSERPADAAAFASWLAARWSAAAPGISAVSLEGVLQSSRRYVANSLRCSRSAAFFAEAEQVLRDWLAAGLGPAPRCWQALRRQEDLAYSGDIRYDDEDTGTYHSFGHDAPFVHYLERVLESLPEEGSPGFALLDGAQQESLRRQRRQARAHLDYLMRHKYAHDGILETDIERSLGGRLIDRESRRVVSEQPSSREGLVPRYELLRLRPDAEHPLAGAWLYRSAQGLHGEAGGRVEVDEGLLRSVPVPAEQLSFQRAPGSPLLREGMRLDWDGSGWVSATAIGWVDWAGHCDIKAIMESIGLTLNGVAELAEYRSDTDAVQRYDEELLREMMASVFELGSTHRRLDGSGELQRGGRAFGGARNDSRPDRLQFAGPPGGRSFRWPLSGRQEAFRVVGIELGGEQVDPKRAFFRDIADPSIPDFRPNPRYLKTVEGDYNLIDVSGAVLQVEVIEDELDPQSGYLREARRKLSIDLRPGEAGARVALGTAIKDAGARELYRLWLLPADGRVEAEVWVGEKQGARWVLVERPAQKVSLAIQGPPLVTLSREMKRDDPGAFQTLLNLALRKGQNICADTDQAAEVWNGVVTEIHAQLVSHSEETAVERWRYAIRARFGSATLELLLRRGDDGLPVAWCPVGEEGGGVGPPDFLWQELPDVASKGMEGRDWITNSAMAERGIVELAHQRGVGADVYVYDDHMKNIYELLYCGLSGLSWTVVHQNKRYAFRSEGEWKAAVSGLQALRRRLGLASPA